MSPTSYQTAPPRGVGATLAPSTDGPTRAVSLSHMRWRRRSTHVDHNETTTALVPAPRVERALVALAVQTQRLDDRIDRLERRLDDHRDATDTLPTHEDVMDVRLHSARVAAELVRVAVE